MLQDINVEYNMQNCSSSHTTEDATSKILVPTAPGSKKNCYADAISLPYDSQQVTKYQPAQASLQ